ncbi:MAG: 2-oxoacid:acceptor oxidoreductase family protein [Candidatus Gastranaerophilaceae bacterium]
MTDFYQKLKRRLDDSKFISGKEIKSRTDINYVFAPITKLAENVGNIKMANILALGLLAKTSKLVSLESLTKALDIVIPPHRKNLLPLNIEALKIGYEYDLLPV